MSAGAMIAGPPRVARANLSFWGLLALQARILGALVIRETRASFGKSQLGYLWEIITPAGGMVVLVVIFTALGRKPPFGESLALFFATGILTLYFFRKLSASMMGALTANKALLTYPPIKETDTLLARAILVVLTYVLIMAVFYGGLIALGMAGPPHRPEVVVQALAATAALGFGVGMFNAFVLTFWASWSNVYSVMSRPLFFLSGIFYVPSYMPPHLIAILEWNPVLHLVEWMRMGYYPNYHSMVFDPYYPLTMAMVLTVVGLAGERLTRARRS
jgi:capsular polysaccharide transport system permease protein